MICPRCGKQNEPDARFCAKCGRKLEEAAREAAINAAEAGEAQPCYRHPKELTNLSCGRCGRPICTRCAILGPAGPRCPDCAKNQVAVRPAAILHAGKRSFRSIFTRSPWTLYIGAILVLTLLGLFRDCAGALISGNRPAPSTQQGNR